MKSDEFEKHLQAQPLRPIPPGWRDDILRQAAAAEPAIQTESGHNDNPHSPTGSTGSAAIRGGWREWLWPSPAAWAGLAAVWMVIAALHAISDWPSTQMARPATPGPASDTVNTVAAQRRELVRLLENAPEPAPSPTRAPAPNSKPPGPRGEAFTPPKA